MKIIFVTNEYSDISCGGAGVYAFELVKHLTTVGHEVFVVFPDAKQNIKAQKNVFLFPVSCIQMTGLKTPSYWWNLRSVVWKIEAAHAIDVIHSNSNAGVLLNTTLPLITTIQHPAVCDNSNFLLFQRMLNNLDILAEKIIVTKSQRIVATSESTAGIIKTLYPRARQKIVAIKIGVDVDIFSYRSSSKSKIYQHYSLDKKLPLVFLPGAKRAKRKGLLEVLPVLNNLRNSAHFLVSGESREHGWLNQLNKVMKELNLESKIIFTGELEYDKLPDFYSASDIVLFPSLFEGYGLPTLEALSCGRPVLATDTGEASKLIKNGKNGFLVKNAEDCYEKLKKLIEDRDMRELFSRTARDSVIDSYGWSSIARKYISLYEHVAK